jgi:hypothetical protein
MIIYLIIALLSILFPRHLLGFSIVVCLAAIFWIFFYYCVLSRYKIIYEFVNEVILKHDLKKRI